MNDEIIQSPGYRKWLIFLAWFSILVISDLPDITFKYATGGVPVWIFWSKISFLFLFLAACIIIRQIRLLLSYAIVMLVFYLALAASDIVRTSEWWIGLIGDNVKPSFTLLYLRPFIRDIGVTVLVIGALWIVKKKRRDFFLVKGQLDAPVEPVRWLGIREGESWERFGWIFAVIAAFAVAVPTILSLRPSAEILKKCIPLIPASILFAAINAFNEELYFRATLLSTLTQVIGKNNALLINVVFFGMAHYLYGSPPGIIGFMMTGFLAFLLGKSMIETKGFLWPWVIHFIPDVMIFFSYAILWIRQLG
jgi:membrane protease YdiL (CAAX protease family)